MPNSLDGSAERLKSIFNAKTNFKVPHQKPSRGGGPSFFVKQWIFRAEYPCTFQTIAHAPYNVVPNDKVTIRLPSIRAT